MRQSRTICLVALIATATLLAACGEANRALSRPNALAVSADGELWVSDFQHQRVVRFSSDGRFLGSVGKRGLGRGEIYRCFGLSLVGPDRLAFTNHRLIAADQVELLQEVKLFDLSGQELDAWPVLGIDGRTTSAGPRAMATHPSGDLLVADEQQGVVMRFGKRGALVGAFFGPVGGDPIEGPAGLATAGQQTWISELNAHRVRRFDAELRETGRWGGEGSTPGQLLFPKGLDVAADGSWFVVADMGNHRVQRLSARDGTVLSVIEPAPLAAHLRVQLTDVAIMPPGDRLAIVDLTGDRVLITDLDGTVQLELHDW